MELAEFILEEARSILSQEDIKLPAQIKSAPEFYVAEGTDSRVLAFSALKYKDKIFKIGSLKVTR